MYGLKKWLNKTPALILFFALPLFCLFIKIEINAYAIYLAFPVLLLYILLVYGFTEYLKEKRFKWYYLFLFFYGYTVFAFPAFILVFLDNKLRLGGLLWIPGIILETASIIWLFLRYRIKRPTRLVYTKEELDDSYTFENFCADFAKGCRIEFLYDYERYVFIHENGRYYFKRIIAINPYEYEMLAEAGDALACIGASSVNGKTISGLWPDIEKIIICQ